MIVLVRRHCYKAARWVDKIDNFCGVQERRNESDDANINGDEKQYEERERVSIGCIWKKREREKQSSPFLFEYTMDSRWESVSLFNT